MSWEIIPFTVNSSPNAQQKGEIYAAFEEKPSSEVSEAVQVERVPTMKRIFSILLKPEDYSMMVIENDFLRNPHEHEHTIKPLYKAANDDLADAA